MHAHHLSSFRIFYWLTSRFELALLIQAVVMIGMHVLLLTFSLRFRNFGTSTQRDPNTPFAGTEEKQTRPYNFWQWTSARPYWMTLAYYTAGLVVLQILLGWSSWYSALQGYVALGVEATLPLPQVIANERAKSVKGFRLSVLVNWVLGDIMKMTYFFMAESPIPWAFKFCGLFQSACDAYLGVQYWKFQEGKDRSGPSLEDGVASKDGMELDTRWKPAKDPRHQSGWS
jgi:solute carrier family 66, member 2